MNTDQYIDVDEKALDILLTVANSYTFNTRAMQGAGCMYRTDGVRPRMCGVGMWFDPDTAPEWAWEYADGVDLLARDLEDRGLSLDDILVERARGLSIAFWLRVQSFHDTTTNWSLTGLSGVGWRRLNSMIRNMSRTEEEA